MLVVIYELAKVIWSIYFDNLEKKDPLLRWLNVVMSLCLQSFGIACSKLALPRPTQLPTVLGIDEYKGNAEGQMYQVIITDLKNHSVVDILP